MLIAAPQDPVSALVSCGNIRMPVLRERFSIVGAMAAIFNLNHPAHTLQWHFVDLSVANVVVLILMLVVFVLAIALPFPGHPRRS